MTAPIEIVDGLAELRATAATAMRTVRIARKRLPRGAYSGLELVAYRALLDVERKAGELLTAVTDTSR